MTEQSVLAIDLGAESGRVMRVGFDGERFSLEELHRFRNLPIETPDTLYWNAPRLWYDIQTGIYQGMQRGSIASMGVTSWGVDFALLDTRGHLIDNPVHYRDGRTAGMVEWVFERVPARLVFERTRIQLMSINTLFQLASLKRADSPALTLAHKLLTIPSLFSYWLSGAQVSEFTHVTTTQCYNPRAQAWDEETLGTLDIPTEILPEVVQPGTRIGAYRGVPVIAATSHDTASAVVAVPATTPDYAYLSSGTWSLFGLEVPQPIISDAAFAAAITNEGGAYGTYRLLQNVMGLWLAQQSRATWAAAGKQYSYDELVRLAETAEPFRSLVNPNDARFLEPGDMPQRIRDICRETGQPIPESEGQVMRCIFESLALRYRLVLDRLLTLTGRRVQDLHIVGGGSRNELLNQMTANATGRRVIAGPVESTALGTAIVQFITLGEIASIEEARAILSRSAETKIYEPQETAIYEMQYERLLALSQ